MTFARIIGLVVALAGCVAGPATPGPSGDTTPPVVASPATSSAVDSARPTPVETGIQFESMNPADFWEGVAGGDAVQDHFDSLQAIIAASDLVAVGTLSAIRAGRDVKVPETGETQYQATVTVHVDRTIKGSISPSEGDAAGVDIEYLMSFSDGHYSSWSGSMPKGEQVLLFLVNKGAEAERLGIQADRPGWGDAYYWIRNTQGYVRNVAGVASVRSDPDPAWLAGWAGAPFDSVVDAVVAAVGRS